MSAFSLADIVSRFEKAQADANAANEQRYQQILSSLGGQGKSAYRRIDQGTTQALGASDQDLTSRGLGNTTIRSTAQRGIRSDAENAKLAVDEQVAGMKAGVMERRNDIGPDFSMYANLLQQAAASNTKPLSVQVPRGVPAGGIGGGGGAGGGGGLIGQTGLIQPGGGGGGGGGTDASIIRGGPSTGGAGVAVPSAGLGGSTFLADGSAVTPGGGKSAIQLERDRQNAEVEKLRARGIKAFGGSYGMETVGGQGPLRSLGY